MENNNCIKMKSIRLDKEFEAEVYEKDNNLIVRHTSLENIYWQLTDEERPSFSTEILQLSSLPGIPPMFALKGIMVKDNVRIEQIGEMLCMEWEFSNIIKKNFPLTTCRNIAFDRAFIRYMQFKVDSYELTTLYSSAEIAIDGGISLSDKSIAEINQPAAIQSPVTPTDYYGSSPTGIQPPAYPSTGSIPPSYPNPQEYTNYCGTYPPDYQANQSMDIPPYMPTGNMVDYTGSVQQNVSSYGTCQPAYPQEMYMQQECYPTQENEYGYGTQVTMPEVFPEQSILNDIPNEEHIVDTMMTEPEVNIEPSMEPESVLSEDSVPNGDYREKVSPSPEKSTDSTANEKAPTDIDEKQEAVQAAPSEKDEVDAVFSADCPMPPVNDPLEQNWFGNVEPPSFPDKVDEPLAWLASGSGDYGGTPIVGSAPEGPDVSKDTPSPFPWSNVPKPPVMDLPDDISGVLPDLSFPQSVATPTQSAPDLSPDYDKNGKRLLKVFRVYFDLGVGRSIVVTDAGELSYDPYTEKWNSTDLDLLTVDTNDVYEKASKCVSQPLKEFNGCLMP